jgi:HEAT repeat protein
LGALGPKAADALPRLLNILSEPSARLQLQSASAIHAIDRKHKAVVPALIRCLRDKDEIIRVRAAIELGYVGADAVGDVIPLLKDEDERVRRAAADALAGIGPKASPAIPALRAALKDKDEGVRESAGDAIKAIEAKSNGSR